MNPSEPNIKTVSPLGAKPAPDLRVRIIAVVALLAVILVGYKLFHHHRNTYEATADAVTVAIEKNDMTPVLHKFNAIRLPELEDRERVGRLSNILVPLGAFKGSKEITPAGSDAGFHEFTETFSNGTLEEKYELDADGKIVKFHIGPPASASSAP